MHVLMGLRALEQRDIGMNLPEASFVHPNQSPFSLVFVFEGVLPAELLPYREFLQPIADITVYEPEAREDFGSFLRIDIQPHAPILQIIGKLKEILRPKLPIVLSEVNLEVNACHQGIASHRRAQALWNFLPGFKPKNLSDFTTKFSIIVGTLSQGDFFSNDGTLIADVAYCQAMNVIFTRLGAHTVAMQLTLSYCC
jgi:hypothetical protein